MVCPECEGRVKRLMYPVGIVFKGSGWYINDSRKPDKSEEGDKKPAEAKSGETATESKGDSSSSEGDSGGNTDTSQKGTTTEKKATAPEKTETTK